MTKAQKSPESDAPVPAPELAHNIWLAGLGAWAHAQAEGNKMFETLVRDGLDLQRQTQLNLAQATEQFAAMTSKANQAHLDGLSSVFEQRVALSLSRMGFPRAEDWLLLLQRLTQLEAAVWQLQSPLYKGADPDESPDAAARKATEPRKK